MLRRRVSTLMFLALLVAPAGAQPDRADEFLKAEMHRQNIPGLALAVVKDGKIIKAEGYGFADLKKRTRVQAETVFRIASVSKQFIATGIMLLAQDGRLGVDDPINKYLTAPPARWDAITIRHALTHTAGLVREAPGFNARKVQSDADVIKSAYGVPLEFAPGAKYLYSNLGYFILGEIIRKASGRAWVDYLHDEVFKASEMHATYPTNTKERIPLRSSAYVDNDKLDEVDDNWPALRPSGAFLSTVLDMAKWDAMLYTERILTPASREQMWTPVKLTDGTTYPYGFGWQLGSVRGHRVVYHAGGGPGIRTVFARFVDERLSFVILMNLDDVDPDAILDGLAGAYLPR